MSCDRILVFQPGVEPSPLSVEAESFFFFLTFYFVLGYARLTNSFMVVSGEQRRDSAVRIHVSILPQIPLPSRLPHNIEQSSMWKHRALTTGPLGKS